MAITNVIKREIEVAFSKHAQPVWFRVLKYILLLGFIYLYWHSPYLWPVLLAVFGFSLLLHLWYRYKTKGWTQSYGLWKYELNKPKNSKP